MTFKNILSFISMNEAMLDMLCWQNHGIFSFSCRTSHVPNVSVFIHIVPQLNSLSF